MAIKTDSRQIEHRNLLTILGIAEKATLKEILGALENDLDYPLRPRANIAPDGKVYFSNAMLTSADDSNKVLGAIKKQVYTAPANLWIDFQAGTVSNASYFDVTFPASTVGQYRRVALFFLGTGKIKALFSDEAATQAALINVGQILPSSIIPLGYVDVQCTNALGRFKSATASSNVIEAQDIYRFSPGAGGGGGQGTTFDQDQTSHGFALLDPIYFDGTTWKKAQANSADTLASYVVVEVPNPNQFTAAKFGQFEIPNALTPGQYYFVSDSVLGGLTTDEPMFGYSNPVLFVQSSTLVHIMAHRPSAIGDGIVSDSDIGAIMAFPSIAAPTGYLFADGRAVSRVTYSDLFAVVGTRYGSGDGVTTFNLPDFRGYFLRGAQSDSTSFPAASVNTSTDAITAPSHGLGHSGTKIQFTTTGSFPGGIGSGINYFAIVIDANTFKVASTLANALAGTAIDLTSQGGGTHTVIMNEDPDASSRFAAMLGGATGNSAGTAQSDLFGAHNHQSFMGYHGGNGSGSTSLYLAGVGEISFGGVGSATHDASTTAGGNETRPKNISVGFFIRYSARGAIKGDSVPSGTILSFGGDISNVPAGYLMCDGSALTRTDFPKLFGAIGTAWGAPSASTFNLPDARGRFLRGVDYTAGNDPDKTSRSATNTGGNTGNNVGTLQSDAFQDHTHSIYTYEGGAGAHPGAYRGGTNTVNGGGQQVIGANSGNVASETRPKNVSVNYIIKV